MIRKKCDRKKNHLRQKGFIKAFLILDFFKSTNTLCEKQEGRVGGKTVSVIDTTGLFNTAMKKHQLKDEIEKNI